MAESVDFELNDALKLYLSDPNSIPTPEANSALVDCENEPELLSTGLVNNALNPIVDAVVNHPDAILQPSCFDSLQFLLKFSAHIPSNALCKIFDLITSGFSSEADIINNDLDLDSSEAAQFHKRLLEMFAFLLQWTVAAVEARSSEKSGNAAATKARAGKTSKAKQGGKDNWDGSRQLEVALDVMAKVLKLRLTSLFVTTSERDAFVSLFTRPVYLIQESETRMKSTATRMHTYKSLSYFEHLSEPMAELLQILTEQYDHSQLAEEILRELSVKEFNSNDVRGPKSVSLFVAKLSELAPRLVMKQMSSLAKFLDSEVCGNLIAMLSKLEVSEQAENHKTQVNAFFEVLEERFLDINPYCRCRALQVYTKICDLEVKFPKRRQTATELATRSLEDKSSNVRRNAIKLLGKLISTHPFAMLHGGQLSLNEWEGRLDAVQSEIDALKPPAGTPGLQEKSQDQKVDDDLLDDATQIEENEPQSMSEEQHAAAMHKAAEEAATSEAINKLNLTRRYYMEAIRFISVLHEATLSVCQLLLSKNKSEVIEAMDYFLIADAYHLDTSRTGIRKMLHLIWTKGNSDEGKGVQAHLIECYKAMFFDAPKTFNANDTANYIARNMISLTFGASISELTSLEQLLSTMAKGGMISELVISKLWQVYGIRQKEISKNQRRGAMQVLSMLALAKPEILVEEVETMLVIGLGAHGRADLALAKQTCVALSRIKPAKTQTKAASTFSRLPNDHAILSRLALMVELDSEDKEWYGVAEQAIGAIYALAKHPDVLCTQILRRKTKQVFAKRLRSENLDDEVKLDEDGDTSMTAATSTGQESQIDAQDKGTQSSKRKSTIALTQLLFIVGHIAIKQIVHLELCELDFKRRKAEKDKYKTATATASPTKKSKKEEDEAELDLIGGTTEDDFTDAIAHIREREILFGANAILSNFGPLVKEICSNNTNYPDADLQAVAAICLAKLMCVSSEYCEANLPLLITILEQSVDPITRSNVVIALGDMAVCFNNLIDENTDFLYRRLNDGDASVKRTCLMTLTFLILAGQVKVKGQLGEMAKCLEESDKRIADLSRMFFTELSTKDNAIYNQFVDMFSVLSNDRTLEEESFRRILRFLCTFIEKEKHSKQLSQKLAARLPRCDSERQWNDVAYALSLLQHKDEDIQKTLAEGFKVVQAAA